MEDLALMTNHQERVALFGVSLFLLEIHAAVKSKRLFGVSVMQEIEEELSAP
jgi:hypothetical protein